MKTHKDLDIWKMGITLAENVYKITAKYPKEEVYTLSSQMRRSAISVSSNIAEGAARGSNKEFLRFLYISLGSLSELETQIMIAKKIGYTGDGELVELVESLRPKLLNFIKYLKNKESVQGNMKYSSTHILFYPLT